MRLPDAQDAETGTRNGSQAQTLHARASIMQLDKVPCTALVSGQHALHLEAIQKQCKAYTAKPMVWYVIIVKSLKRFT